MASHVTNPRPAEAHLSFQADHTGHALHQGWSVLIEGHTRKITSEPEIRHLGTTTGLQPWNRRTSLAT